MRPHKARYGLDGRLWHHPGIGRYLRELFFAMTSIKKGGHFRLLLPSDVMGEPSVRHSGAVLQRAMTPIYGLREQMELASFSLKTPVLHVPHFNVPLVSSGRLVVTVHDLIYLKDVRHTGSSLGRAYVQFLFKTIERRADAVLTVSEFTKKDLLKDFPGLKDRVHVTPEAASPFFRPASDDSAVQIVEKRFGVRAPYVLFVGSLKAHKNVTLLMDAVSELHRQKGIEHELVLVGRHDPKEKEILRQIEWKKDFVRPIGVCSDEDLLRLYHAAEVLVLPSEWEGFGLPVLEAMACGTPVIASNRCSLPEVGGEAALYFEPGRVDALMDLLYNVLHNRDLRQKMSVMGLEQASKFSWHRTAEETLAVYERVLG